MKFRFSKLTASLVGLTLLAAVPQILAKKKDKPAETGLDEQKRAVHALNRLAFGPRPGDVQLVMAMGVDRWIDLQLHPEKISDDALQARLAPLRTLHMSEKEIMEDFPDNQMIKQVADGKKPMPSDPARRAVYQVQIARYDEKLERKAQAASAPAQAAPAAADAPKTAEELAAAAAADGAPTDNSMSGMNANGQAHANGSKSNAASETEMAMPPSETAEAKAAKPAAEDEAEARRREDRLYADLEVQGLVDLPPAERYKKVMSMSLDQQVSFANSLRGGKGQDFLAGMDPRQKETLMAMSNPQAVVIEELAQAKLMRAIYSERQLEEVMTDFWFNHFNVFVGKGPERLLLTNYEQQVIRPHALGKFEDLLVATAKSPAMLFYLDNWMSVGPNSLQARGIPAHPGRFNPYRYPPPSASNPNAKRRQSGLNENYGRELLELHTLSVSGGYSQRDVTEVAKVFTGWTLEKPNEGMTFRYDPRKHEPGPKFVLGHKIKDKGEGEGVELLHMLATSPQTAHFISLKLAQRFVSDDPPPALVDRMTKTFLKKKGDIREVLTTLFQSPEFWSDTSYRAKVKTPLEFVASAVRATGADVDDALPLIRQLQNMGMPLYGAQPPTGYSMKADAWVSSSALLNRMNFALALTAGKVKGIKVDAVQLAGGPPPPPDAAVALSTMEIKLLASDVSKQTHDSIIAQLASPPASPASPAKNIATASNGPSDAKMQRKPADPARPPDTSMMAGLLLGSPEFQRR